MIEVATKYAIFCFSLIDWSGGNIDCHVSSHCVVSNGFILFYDFTSSRLHNFEMPFQGILTLDWIEFRVVILFIAMKLNVHWKWLGTVFDLKRVHRQYYFILLRLLFLCNDKFSLFECEFQWFFERNRKWKQKGYSGIWMSCVSQLQNCSCVLHEFVR